MRAYGLFSFGFELVVPAFISFDISQGSEQHEVCFLELEALFSGAGMEAPF